MNHNNRKWYTLFVIDPTTREWEVLAHLRGEGFACLCISRLRGVYEQNQLRTLEGRHDRVTDKLKARFFV